MRIIKWIALLLLNFYLFNFLFPAPIDLKNIITIDGFQDNPILGMGIVTGLKGTGDDKGTQTKEIAARIFKHFGFNVNPDDINPKNSAAVLVSAVVSPSSSVGSRLDVKISSICNAKSLEGGELIVTPLFGGENREDIYAIAQGSIIVDKTSKGVTGYIPMGGILQKEIEHLIVSSNRVFSIGVLDTLHFTSISKVADAIRAKYPDSIKSITQNKIKLSLPPDIEFFQFINDIYQLKADVEDSPSVIIDSKKGIIVSGGNVIVTDAAISLKGMKLVVGNGGSAPSWGGNGASQQSGNNVQYFKTTTTVSDLVDGLNKTGASIDDMIELLQLMYKNGNLKAKLIVL